MIDYGRGVKLHTNFDIDRARYWRNDPEVYRTCRQDGLITSGENKAYWENHRKDSRMYFIERDSWNVGVCGLTSLDHKNQKAEFSLYIARDYRGKGLAKAALYTLLCHGFFDLNLNRIWGEMFSGNPAESIFRGLGMQKEGLLKETYFKEGKFIDSVIFAIRRDKWNRTYKQL